MAGRRKSELTPTPAAGGTYEFEVIELGPPVYFSPPPEVKARGPLVPYTDKVILPHSPGESDPPGESRRPTA